MTFAEKIKNLRKQQGLSQKELADALNVSLRTVTGWETENRYPNRRDIYSKLSEVLGCDITYLMSDQEQFITQAAEEFGERGARQAQKLTDELVGLFAGGSIDEEDMAKFRDAIEEAYFIAKRKNKEKYGSGSRKNKGN